MAEAMMDGTYVYPWDVPPWTELDIHFLLALAEVYRLRFPMRAKCHSVARRTEMQKRWIDAYEAYNSKPEDGFLVAPLELQVSDDETDDYKHAKLLQAIGSLDGKKRNEVQRSEPSARASVFHLAPGHGKVELRDLVGALRNTASHGAVKKQLGKIQAKQKTLQAPLPKNELDKIQRSVAYENTNKDISKWDPVVLKNRKADQLEFPLIKPVMKLRTTNQMSKGFKPRTPLEIEVASILANSNSVPTMAKELTPAEERALEAMSVEEAKARRAELQKYRALLSYKEAKARRQKKIKSRRYHRTLRKERQRAEKKNLEELEKRDPEAYADLLLKMQKDRIEERMTLKHRGGSRVMQRQAAYAKHDEKARQAMADMLEKSKELRQKTEMEESSSDMSDDGQEEDEAVPSRYLPDGHAVPSSNPWMDAAKASPSSTRLTPLTNQHKEAEQDSDEEDDACGKDGPGSARKCASDVLQDSEKQTNDEKKNDDSADEEEEELEQLNISRMDIDDIFTEAQMKIKKTAAKEKAKLAEKKTKERERRLAKMHAEKGRERKQGSKEGKKRPQEESDSDLSDSESDVDDDEEGQGDVEQLVVDSKDTGLKASLKRKKTMDDMEDDWSDGNEEPVSSSTSTGAKTPAAQGSKKTVELQVDPKKYLTVGTNVHSEFAPASVEAGTDEQEQNADDQRMTIAQAFAADDVIEEFRTEKKTAADRDKPKDIDLSLPGWGEWGGTGVVMSKRKKKRFIIKAPRGPPRKDSKLKGVIISEAKDTTIAKHQVKSLPFPFTSVDQFEASIRAPIGKTWNPETAYRMLIKPKVVTKMGSIIDPIDKAEVFKKQNSQLSDNNDDDKQQEASKKTRKGKRRRKKNSKS